MPPGGSWIVGDWRYSHGQINCISPIWALPWGHNAAGDSSTETGIKMMRWCSVAMHILVLYPMNCNRSSQEDVSISRGQFQSVQFRFCLPPTITQNLGSKPDIHFAVSLHKLSHLQSTSFISGNILIISSPLLCCHHEDQIGRACVGRQFFWAFVTASSIGQRSCQRVTGSAESGDLRETGLGAPYFSGLPLQFCGASSSLLSLLLRHPLPLTHRCEFP